MCKSSDFNTIFDKIYSTIFLVWECLDMCSWNIMSPVVTKFARRYFYRKDHSQCNKFINLGVIQRDIIRVVFMPNMKYLFLTFQKLWWRCTLTFRDRKSDRQARQKQQYVPDRSIRVHKISQSDDTYLVQRQGGTRRMKPRNFSCILWGSHIHYSLGSGTVDWQY